MCRSITLVPVSPASGRTTAAGQCHTGVPCFLRAPLHRLAPPALAADACESSQVPPPADSGSKHPAVGGKRAQMQGAEVATCADNAAFLVEECVGVKRLEAFEGVEARKDTAVPGAPVGPRACRICWPILPVRARRHKAPAASKRA
jgi:hypothetical protein